MNIIDLEKTEQARYFKHIARAYSKQHLAYTHTYIYTHMYMRACEPTAYFIASEPVCNVLRERDYFTQETLRIRTLKNTSAHAVVN